MTEVRHAAAATIAESQAVPDRCLPRFNARFRFEAGQSEPAQRALDPALDLGLNLVCRTRARPLGTRWPSTAGVRSSSCPARTSYAGPKVQVVERADGTLSIRHHGDSIAMRLAPPLAGTLRTAQAELASHPDHERFVSGRGSGGALPSKAAVERNNGATPQAAANRPRAAAAHPPRQLPRWKAIQQAQLQELSIRATARMLGISRVTVSNYVHTHDVLGAALALLYANGSDPALTDSLPVNNVDKNSSHCCTNIDHDPRQSQTRVQVGVFPEDGWQRGAHVVKYSRNHWSVGRTTGSKGLRRVGFPCPAVTLRPSSAGARRVRQPHVRHSRWAQPRRTHQPSRSASQLSLHSPMLTMDSHDAYAQRVGFPDPEQRGPV